MKTVKSLLIVALVACMLVAAVPGQAQSSHLTPVVLFPGANTTRLEIRVDGQTAFPECPPSGTFFWIGGNPNPSPLFNQVCQDKLMTLRLDPDRHKPMSERISSQPGVTVLLADYGQVESVVPEGFFYDLLFAQLEQAGHVRNASIRVAGYDSRLTPDLGGFLGRTIALIKETYRQNGNTPVHLVAFSYGNTHVQYLLTHTSQAWKNKYIHGWTAMGGPWGGTGWALFHDFVGFNANLLPPGLPADPENAASSAAMHQTWPGRHVMLPDPAVYKKDVVVVRVQGGKQYTPKDYRQLFRDAGMPVAAELASYYVGFVKFATPNYFPNVDVYAEIGSGLDTITGLELRELKAATWASNVSDVFLRDGDDTIDDISNDAIRAWEKMRCYHFELNDNPGVHHIFLPFDPNVVQRLLTHLQQPRSVCPSR